MRSLDPLLPFEPKIVALDADFYWRLQATSVCTSAYPSQSNSVNATHHFCFTDVLLTGHAGILSQRRNLRARLPSFLNSLNLGTTIPTLSN